MQIKLILVLSFSFLAYMHYGNFFVFNLCDTYYSSDGIIGQYDPSMLFNQVRFCKIIIIS